MRARRKPGDDTRIADLAHEAGVPVADVLREVADFRLALETDMIIAAAAVDAEQEGLVGEMVDGNIADLASFQDRVLDRLADAAVADARARETQVTRSRGLRLRLVTAAALVLGVVGGGTIVSTGDESISSANAALATADRQLGVLAQEVASPDSSRSAVEAAQDLHETIQDLLDSAAEDDPAVAAKLANLLIAEQTLMAPHRELSGVLRASQKLLRKLKPALPNNVPAVVEPPAQPAPQKSAAPSPSASPKASPKPSPKSSPSPKPSPSSTSTSTSSPAGDDNGGLPTGGSTGRPI